MCRKVEGEFYNHFTICSILKYVHLLSFQIEKFCSVVWYLTVLYKIMLVVVAELVIGC
jgi:hypothetical protein